MEARINRWIANNTEGEVKAAHLTTMKANLLNKTGSSKSVEAVIAILEAEGKIKLEDRVRGKSGSLRAEWRKEALLWAAERGWEVPKMVIKSQEEIKPEAVLIEYGGGWDGTKEGLGNYFRVVSVDSHRQTIVARRRKSVPDLLTTFKKLAKRGKKRGGTSKWIGKQAGMKKGELAGIWTSASCKEGCPAQGFNKKKRGGKGPNAGKAFSKETLEDINICVEACLAPRRKDKAVQYCFEQPGQSAIKDIPAVKRLGKEVVVKACAYGERKSGKTYRFWLSPETAEKFKPVDPESAQSLCEECKAKPKRPHTQAFCPPKGSSLKRIQLAGMTVAAARNRVPPLLAAHIGRCMKEAWEEAKL